MYVIKILEILAPYLGILFVFCFFVKIINFIIFDYYQTSLGAIGSLLIGIFNYYKRYEINNEENKQKKVSKLINNICGYIMLSIIAIPTFILFVLYLFN